MRRLTQRSAVSCLLALTAYVSADAPPLWTDLDFNGAREKAAEEERILLVYATAVWCGPCRMMERTTWASENVREWLAEHGVAYKLDVDQEGDLAEAHDVQYMPTLIAYRNNEVFDRTGGYQTEEALLEWLENVREGKREIDRLLEAAGERVGPDGRVNVQERLNLARSLSNGGALNDAMEEYLWLWDNMLDHQPGMAGVRLSFMASDMQRLAKRHEPAMEAFRKRRAEYWPRIEDGSATRHDVVDWVTLAGIVDEEDSLLEWFDAARNDPAGRETIRHGGHRMERLLIERGRWADVAYFYPDDLIKRERLHIEHEVEFERMDMGEHEGMRARVQATHVRMRRERLSRMYAVLLAAGRDDEADQVVDLLIEFDDSTAARGSLVKTALEAGEVRPRMLRLIEEAEEMGARVPRARRQVTEALAARDD